MRFVRSVRGFLRRVKQLEIPIYAAYASYFIILAIFPAMMLLIAVLQYTPLRAEDLKQLLERVIPISLGGLLDYMINELFAVDSVTVLSVSAVVALWMASRGIVSLHKGLNRVYSVRETRSGIRIFFRSILFTVIGVLVMVVLLALNLLSRRVISLLISEGNALGRVLLTLFRLKYLISVVLLTLIFTAMYCAFPNRKSRISDALPGAFLTAVLWIVFSQLFSLYVENIANYSIYYGSLSVIAIAMLWLYVCQCIVFLGGMLNCELERLRKRRKRTEAKDEGKPEAKP